MLDIERDSGARWVEQMLVHPDQAGDHGVIGEVDAAGSNGRLCAIGRANALDTSMIDYNSLIFLGRGTGAIDQACVL